ncbi:hypothetical protein [Roseateles sp.]|uniref:hypothetical protein n=1 Tax=Roseateles sp. TaxID=1971397 RepID=UPI003267E57F
MNALTRITQLSAACALTLAASLAQAQVTIDQNKALAGNITPGDAPGYPITITRPGLYKLVGNLSVPGGTDGIQIAADDVTIDMNGFTLGGSVSCTRNSQTRVVSCAFGAGFSTGIDSSFKGAFNGFVVRDGTVRGFGQGVRGVEGETLLRMHITQNEGYGVATAMTFAGMSIIDSIVDLNGSTGIAVGNGLIRGSRVGHNGKNGIQTSNMIVESSFVMGNKNIGMQSGAARGVWLLSNGTNRDSVQSLGGNIDSTVIF